MAVVVLLLANGGAFAYWVFSSTRSKTDVAQGRDVDAHVVSAQDGQVEITLPAGWAQRPSPFPDALLYAENLEDQLALLVFSEDKQALQDLDPYYRQLPHYSALLHQLLLRELIAGEQGNPIRTTIGGFSAVQCTIRGTLEGVEFVFLHTVVETPAAFYQVRVFTTADGFDSFHHQFTAICESFRFTGA